MSEIAKPLLGERADGIYERCVWCGDEIYLPAVIKYSLGEIACAAANECEQYIPAEYIKLDRDSL